MSSAICFDLDQCKILSSGNIPFSDRPIEDADDNWNVAIKGFGDTYCIENIVENGDIALFEQFHLFSTCFP